MTTRKQSQGRTMHPDPNWRSRVEEARENDQEHPSSEKLVSLLWAEGFGAIAAARILDWYCSCHPDTIKAVTGE